MHQYVGAKVEGPERRSVWDWWPVTDCRDRVTTNSALGVSPLTPTVSPRARGGYLAAVTILHERYRPARSQAAVGSGTTT